MSGKRSKQIRRTVKKQMRGDLIILWNYMAEQPFKRRCRDAWNLVRGKKI
jgi:hypothetical protein